VVDGGGTLFTLEKRCARPYSFGKGYVMNGRVVHKPKPAALSTTRARSAAILLLLAVPLASGWLTGLPPGFTELPPHTVHVRPPAYAPMLYGLLAVALVVVGVFLAVPRWFGFDPHAESDFSAFPWAAPRGAGRRFPRRGRVGLVMVAAGWAAAWAHPVWLGDLADHTFFPLWLGYVLTIDALVERRTGVSPLTRAPAAWLAWFPASAAAWWYFELLNRFIQNWIYLGVADFSALRYIAGSTLAFSTVVPAVLSTAALLVTFDGFRRRFVRRGAQPHDDPDLRSIWWGAVGAGVIGLAAIPWFPIALFPLVWVAPLLLAAGFLELAGLDTGLGRLLRGDWGPAMTLAAAALVCGFFWELWNTYAMPKWTYQIPWVNRFHLFEMPLVGYLGYLPFGPACWAFWLLLTPRALSRPERPDPGPGPG